MYQSKTIDIVISKFFYTSNELIVKYDINFFQLILWVI